MACNSSAPPRPSPSRMCRSLGRGLEQYRALVHRMQHQHRTQHDAGVGKEGLHLQAGGGFQGSHCTSHPLRRLCTPGSFSC
eukprot:999543-Rhodomonas_salina.1